MFRTGKQKYRYHFYNVLEGGYAEKSESKIYFCINYSPLQNKKKTSFIGNVVVHPHIDFFREEQQETLVQNTAHARRSHFKVTKLYQLL